MAVQLSAPFDPPPKLDQAPAGVELADVGKKYGTGERVTEALRGVDLTLPEGEFVCLIGASGCGKGTLLRIVAGFEQATSGAVRVRGKTVSRPGPDRGVVFQDYGLFPWLTVEGNVAYGPKQRGRSREEVERVVDRFVKTVGL